MKFANRNYWVISDTHFGHDNILNFEGCSRGARFTDVNHMNETIIDNWNRTVGPSDYVYHLGDVFFGSKEKFEKIMPRLNGSKRLIVGNHDNIPYLTGTGFFKKIVMWYMMPHHRMVLTHVPIHMDPVGNHHEKYDFNVHGHIHDDNSPTRLHKNVCVEKVDYTPQNVEAIASELRRRL